MATKLNHSILQTTVVAVITSFICSAAFVFLYFHATSLPGLKRSSTPIKAAVVDPNFAKYQTIINNFFVTVRKGQIQAAYTSTSPVFQKLTSLDQFQTLIAGYQSVNDIPTSPCTVSQYSDPVSSSIKGLPDTYMIAQTQCIVTNKGDIKGFDIEFIDDKGTPKISYINVFESAVTHKNPAVSN